MPRGKFRNPNVTKQEKTYADVVSDFLEEKEAGNKSPATLRNYAQSTRLFAEYHNCNDMPISQITISHIYKFIQHLKENEVRPASINHYLTDLRTVFNWAYSEGIIENPLKIKLQEAQEELPKMYADEDILVLLEKPREYESFTQWRDWAIISTVYATGLRASTLCNMIIDDIDFDDREIRIAKQKNKKYGNLPLSSTLASCLKEYIKMFLKDESKTFWLFPSFTGDKFNAGALNHSLKKYCENRGVDPKGIHAVRHNFARDFIKNGGGEYRLQKFLQHSDIKMSQHYVKLFTDDLREGLESISPLDVAKSKQKRTSRFKRGK